MDEMYQGREEGGRYGDRDCCYRHGQAAGSCELKTRHGRTTEADVSLKHWGACVPTAINRWNPRAPQAQDKISGVPRSVNMPAECCCVQLGSGTRGRAGYEGKDYGNSMRIACRSQPTQTQIQGGKSTAAGTGSQGPSVGFLEELRVADG